MALRDLEENLLRDAARRQPPKPSLEERWRLLDGIALAKPLPPIPWLCEGLRIAPGPITLVAGYGYSRKTMALQSLAVSVAAGKPVWGVFTCRQGPVLHLDYEQGRRLTQERYQRLARAMGVELESLDLTVGCMPNVYLDQSDAPDDLLRICDGAAFVIVDSLRAAFPKMDENSSEARAYLDTLSRVSERTGATIAIIHHARKPSPQHGGTETHAIRGSGAIFDAPQTVFVFEGNKDAPTVVHHQKDRITGSELPDFGLESLDVEINGVPRAGLGIVHLEPEQVESFKVAQREAKQRIAEAEKEARQRVAEDARAAKERAKSVEVAQVIREVIARHAGRFCGGIEVLLVACRETGKLHCKNDKFYSVLKDMISSGSVTKEGSYRNVWFTLNA